MKKTITCGLVCGILLTLAGPARAAPEPMTTDEIIDLAASGVGYSYWWGHGCWRMDGQQPGSCSGSCPNCTHSGSYGADCSGFAGKVWQVPSPSPVSTNSHPYSTREFRYSETHWDIVSRGNARRGDAMVYRNSSNTAGHIIIYESGDPWGSSWVYEAKGCSYGIVHNLRSVSSSYVVIRRHLVDSAPAKGRLLGVVYEDVGAGSEDMSKRIPGAEVSSSSGAKVSARADDAFWSFELEPGAYTASAKANGYDSNSRSCSVQAGADTWCSIGLEATCVPDCSGRECGPDPVCGASCGNCPAGHECTAGGQCECQADCSGRECGPDPVCGTSCGDCPAGHACTTVGQCECQPDCSGRECGPDPVCGSSCGQCDAGQVCNPYGVCEVPEECVPDCSGRMCGPDPICGLSCGLCPPDMFCNDEGACEALAGELGKLYGYVVRVEKGEEEIESHGRPVGRALVSADNGQAVLADEHGYYELKIAPGQYLVTAEAEGCEGGEAECSVEAGGFSECFVPVYPLDEDQEEEDEIVVRGGCATASPGRDLAGIVPLLLAIALAGIPLRCRHRGKRRA